MTRSTPRDADTGGRRARGATTGERLSLIATFVIRRAALVATVPSCPPRLGRPTLHRLPGTPENSVRFDARRIR